MDSTLEQIYFGMGIVCRLRENSLRSSLTGRVRFRIILTYYQLQGILSIDSTYNIGGGIHISKLQIKEKGSTRVFK